MATMDALLRIRADVQGANGVVALSRSLQGVERAATTASVAMRGVQSAVGGLVGLVGGVAIFTKIFGDTATLQTQTRSLEVLLGSASKASQIIKELQAYGSVTPFESTELIETATRLGAFGVVGSRVVEVTKRLGDIAGATGANLGELATAYGQVVSKGRLQTEELLQFQERGVGIQAELQKMYGLSGQELQKALSAGRVSSEAFEQAIVRLTQKGGKYANGAIAQSDTLTGRLSTLKDTVTTLSQTIGAKLEPAINRVLLIATAAVDKINRAMGMGGRAADLQGIAADGFSALGRGQSVAEKRAAFQSAERLANAATPQKSAGGIEQNIGALQQAVSLLRGITTGEKGAVGSLDDRQINLIQEFRARLTDRIAKEEKLLEGLKQEGKPLKVPPLTAGTAKKPPSFKLSSEGKALVASASKLGVSPLDLAQIILFESGGDPSRWGGAGGKYLGLIQMGPSERKQYGANQNQSFEEQVQGPVVRYFQDRFKGVGMSTQGASLIDLYRTVLGGNPKANINGADSFGTTPASGVASMAGLKATALKRFFGGKAENVGYDAAAAGADAAQGFDATQKDKEQAAKQLNAARDLLTTKEAAFEIANAITPLEKLSLEFDNERTRRMQEYVNKLGAAKSDEERLLLVQSQAYDIRRGEIDAQEKLKAITGDQLDMERERVALLADSMARMEEMTTRNSLGAGAQQGIQAYVDSIGNLRDAMGQLTTNAIGGLEESLTSLATTGTANFREFAASILKDTTRMIIRQLILKSIMQIIGGIGGSATAKSFEMPGAAFIPSGGYKFADGGAFANGIVPFANGGIVSSPTLFKFANGGGFNTGLMSESGPEAIMPLRRGADGKLGVAGGGGGSTTINVSVDAKGTSVQGDGSQGAALARAIAGAVQTELIKAKRPGGILAS
jgi:lambda family phage tail tape measure protein